MEDSSTITTVLTTLSHLSLEQIAQRANDENRACLASANKGFEHARAAGEALAEAKTRVSHGKWTSWLAEHFEDSERTAQVYLRIYRRWPEIAAKAQATALLTIEAAVTMIAKPRPIRVPELDESTVWLCEGAGGDVALITPVAHAPHYHRVSVFKDAPNPHVLFDCRGFRYAGHPDRLRGTLDDFGFTPTGKWEARPWDGTEPDHVLEHRSDPQGTVYPYRELEAQPV